MYERTYRVPVIFLLLICLLQGLDLDHKAMSIYYDSDSHSFPLRHHWLTEGVIHDLGRQLIGAIGVVIMIAFLGSFILPSLKPVRREWCFVVASIVISTLIISILKRYTGVYCAYDLLAYGGTEVGNKISNLWQGGGQCWPGGHVSGPLSLMAIYFGFRTKQPVLAIGSLVAALTLGTIFGIGQTLRGAHFPSHTIWTALIIWLVNLMLARVFFPALTRKPDIEQRHETLIDAH